MSPSISTSYQVFGELNGCLGDTITAYLEVNSSFPTADAGDDVIICINESTPLNAIGGSSYLWLNPDGLSSDTVANPDASPTETTTYTVEVTERECSSTAEVTVEVDRCLTNITGPVPQVITPNSDGANDTWQIPDIDYFTDSKLVIFNRWGNIVFEQSNYLNDWEGTNSSNEALPDGTYFYTLDLGNGEEIIKGYVMIQR